MTGPLEIWRDAPGPMVRLGRRVRQSAAARLRPLRRRWTEAFGDRPDAPMPREAGPTFDVADAFPKLSELEAILARPAIRDVIERPPVAPLADAAPPAPRVPLGADALGAPERRAPATIVDIVPFGMELDMLELRLLHLWDLVDRFIVFESARAFGGVMKPLFLQRHLARFDRFRSKLEPIVLDDAFAAQFPGGRRQMLSFDGEDAMKTVFWNTLGPRLAADPDAVVIWSDLDELPARDVVFWLKHFDVALPVRLRTTALRYHFGLKDPEADTDIVVFAPSAAGEVPGPRLRHLPAPVLRSRGTVHLTSFFPPLGLIAKFAMTTEWDPGVLPFVRNEHGETARMIASGRWFERRMTPYDAARDPDGLVPWAARANRARFATFWGEAG